MREFLLHIVSKNIFHYDFPYIFHFMLFLLFGLVFYFYRWNWILRNSRTIPWLSAAAAKGTKTRLYKCIASMLKSSLRRCFGRHHEMVDVSKYQFLKCQFSFLFLCVVIFSFISHGQNYYRIWLWVTHVHLYVVHLIVSKFYYT